jgi:hypothetical protein
MTDHQHFPHTPHDRTYWMIQGVVERPDGTLIRPIVPAHKPEDVPVGHGEILTFLLKGYDRAGESRLLKAWVETITVKSTATVREFNLRPL